MDIPLVELSDGTTLCLKDMGEAAQNTPYKPHPQFSDYGIGNRIEDLQVLAYLASTVAGRFPKKPRPSALEIGTAEGRTALTIEAQGFDVQAVDIWNSLGNGKYHVFEGQPQHVLATFYLNCGDKLCKTVFPHVGRSEEFSAFWPWQHHLIYIDGDHSYEGAKRDITDWLPRVIPGGILCGHDWHFPEVQQAAKELTLSGWSLPQPDQNGWHGLWWMEVPA